MILTLIGYRATGKTTLAGLLAKRLGWEWIDADVEIERRAGKSIQRIFAEDGEPAFRDLEAEVIEELCRGDRLVLAAGGRAKPGDERKRKFVATDRKQAEAWQASSRKLLVERVAFLGLGRQHGRLEGDPRLTRLGPVKGRDNVSLFEVVYKNCPNDLIEIIGEFLMAYESLEGQFGTYKDREVDMNEAVARTMRFNDFVEAQIGGQKIQIKLLSLGVNKIAVEIPGRLPPPAIGQILSTKLYFQTHQFAVNGKVTDVDTLGSGGKKVSMATEFVPELVEIMDDYFFRTSFKKE